MSRIKTIRWIVGAVGLLAVLVFAGGYLVLRSATFHDYARRQIEIAVDQSIGGKTQIGSLGLNVSALTVTLHDVVLHGTETASDPPLLRLDVLTVRLKLRPLLHRNIQLSELLIVHPVVHLKVNARGDNNFPRPTSPSSSHTSVFDLAIGRVSLTNGEIDYQDRKTPLAANLGDLHASVSFRASDQSYDGMVDYSDGRVMYGFYSPLPHNLRAEFVATNSQFSLRSANMHLGSSVLNLRGEVRDFTNPVVDGNYDVRIHTNDFAAMSPLIRPAGDVHFVGTINYMNAANRPLVDCLVVNGTGESDGLVVNSKDGVLNIRRLASTYKLSNGELTARASKIELLGGNITADAQILNLAGMPLSRLQAKVERISIRSVQQSLRQATTKQVALDGAISGTSEAAWSGSLQNLRVKLDLVAHAGAKSQPRNSNAVPVDANVHAIYDGAAQTLVVRQSNVRAPSLTVAANGRIGRDSHLQIHADASDLGELTQLASSFGLLSLQRTDISGSATLDSTVRGTMQNPQISGQLRGQGLHVEGSDWKSLTADFKVSPSQLSISNASFVNAKQGRAMLSASVALREWTVPPNSAVRAKITADKLAISDLQRIADVQYPVSGDVSAKVAVEGTRLDPSGFGAIEISDARIYGEAIQKLGIEFRASSGAVNSNLSVTSGAGLAAATVHYVLNSKAYNLQLDAPSVNLQKLKAFQGKTQISGTLSLSANGQGTIDDPQLKVLANIASLNVDQKSIGDLKADLSLADRRAQMNIDSQVSTASLHARAQVELAGEYETDAAIDTSQIPLGSLLAQLTSNAPEDFTGQTELHATLKGPLKDSSRIEAHFNIPTLQVSYRNLRIAAAQPVIADYAHSVLTLQPAEIRGTGTSLRVQGSIPLAGLNAAGSNAAGSNAGKSAAPSFTAQGSVDMHFLKVLDPDLQSSGAVALDIHAAGTPDHPSVQGQIKLQDVALATATVPLGLEKLNGTLDISNDRVQLSNITGNLGGGEISLGGAITYRPKMQFALVLQGNSVRLRYPTGLRTLLDTNLSLSGDMKASSLTGRVLIDNLSFTPEFDLSTFSDQFGSSVSTPAEPGMADTVRLGVIVQSKGTLRTTSSQVSVEGNVNLNVTGTAANPIITGRTNLTAGELFYRNNRYQVERGVITFTDLNQTDPDFNVAVSTTVEQYKLTINLRGTLDKLRVSYVSDPPLATIDIIHLIAFGNTSSESAANSASQSTDSMIANSALGAGVSGGVQKLAGLSSLQIDPLLGGSNQNPGARIALQQRVTKNFLFTFSTDVSQPGQELVQGDYQINKRWSVTVTRDQLGGVSVAGRLHTKP